MKTKTLMSNCSKAEADVAAARLLHAGIDFDLFSVIAGQTASESKMTYSITVKESDFKRAQKVINDKTYDAPSNRPSLGGASYSASSGSKTKASSSGRLSSGQKNYLYTLLFLCLIALIYGLAKVNLDYSESKPSHQPRAVYEGPTFHKKIDKSKFTPPDFDLKVIDPSQYDINHSPHVIDMKWDDENWDDIPFDSSILISSRISVMPPDTQLLSRSSIYQRTHSTLPIRKDTLGHNSFPNIKRDVTAIPDEKDKNLNQQVEPVTEPSTQQTPEEE